MKKILYALTGVSLLALTPQVSAMTVTNQWDDKGGGTHYEHDTSSYDFDGHKGSNDFKDNQTWDHTNKRSDTHTGDGMPFGPVIVEEGSRIGGPGTYPEAD